VKFYVLIEWPAPDEKPWLVEVEATSADEARAIVETDEVREVGGKIASVVPALERPRPS